MGDNLKAYAFVLALGAVIGITIAEGWRRAVHHDSYADYLPPAAEREVDPADTERPEGRLRAAANRLWSPVAASARRDVTRLRRVRARAGGEPAAVRAGEASVGDTGLDPMTSTV